MRAQARVGDATSHGGIIITGAERTFVNGRAVARVLDLHICPIPFHGVTPIITGSPNTVTEGMANARVGDLTACGAVILTGSPNTDDN